MNKFKNKQKIVWFFAGAGVVAVLLSVFNLYLWYMEKDTIGPIEPQIVQTYKNKSINNEPGEWITFTNKNQGYQFSYPNSGKVVQMHTSGHEKDVDPTDGSCVTIHLNGGYVTIWGKVNKPALASTCLGKALGSEWKPAPDLSIELFGKKYTAKGMMTSSASAGQRQESYQIKTPNGETVKFGIEVASAKTEILNVLKTLKYIVK